MNGNLRITHKQIVNEKTLRGQHGWWQPPHMPFQLQPIYLPPFYSDADSSTIKKCWSFLPIDTCFHIWTALPLPPTGLTSTSSFFLFLTLQGFQPFVSVYIFIFSPEKSPVWRSPRAIDRLERPQTQFEPVSVNLRPFRFLWILTVPIHMQNSRF